jgi:hypothetical protein
MASPQARRRQRSVRLLVAVGLIVASALVVSGAVLSGSPLLVTGSAALSVVLGAAALKIAHTEVIAARREHARDRAEQAQAYRRLTEERTAEHAQFADAMTQRAERQEKALAELEVALSQAQTRAAGATRRYLAAERRAEVAESDNRDVTVRLEEAEAAAAAAQLRVSELEQEIDVLRAELDAWQAAEPLRKHA